MITTRDLVFDYPAVRAVDHVSLSFEAGTITALVGPNGAGKSTLLRCLAALEKPFSGAIDIDGVNTVTDPRQCHRLVGFLPDFFGLYDDFTVRQNLRFFAAAGGVADDAAAAAIEETAAQLWLTERLDTRIKTLSRGMRQRAAIAQVVIKRPRVLLLDEPASGLDPGARDDLSKLFRQLSSEGMTLVVSSHILTELERYADRLVIMNHGRVLRSDDTSGDAVCTEVVVTLLDGERSFETFAAKNDQVIHVARSGEQFHLKVSGGPRECADLLAGLVRHGCSVCGFTVMGRDMQSEYTRALAMCREQTDDKC